MSVLSDWTLRPVSGPVPQQVHDAGPIPATVPGCVHTDLLAAGLIPDPYLDGNERLLAWIGVSSWRYETAFAFDGSGEYAELVFDGLDTVARVELNGQMLGETRNQHRAYRFDARPLLHVGENRLTVTFESAIRHADAESLRLGARPHVNAHPYNAIRKAAYNFGWDWGPDLVTAGIWRPARLHVWSGSRLGSVRPIAHPDGTVEVQAEVVGAQAVLTATCNGVSATSEGTSVTLDAGEVELWWPRGHGAQPLYELTVTLSAVDGEVLDEWRGRIGFRSVELDTAGGAFGFVVNGRPIFVKGCNWIPDDVFVHRAKYAERLAQAEEAGVNLLRIWGGGIYEADEFYAGCDERGIMVWQDFLFACATYAEEDPLRAEVVAEARDNITRIMAHPSLVLWNGNNENLWGYEDWGWKSLLDGKTWGHGYYTEILPALVAELDPGRAYTPGSPFSPSEGTHPNDPSEGTCHIWDVWNQKDYSVYRDYRPRFAAEFGWQAPPAWSTLLRAVTDDPLTPQSPGMQVHQKAHDGNVKLTGGLLPHFRLPSTMDDWHWAMQLNQARAVSTAVPWLRSLMPHCSGSIWWQLNDCWPVVSWALVDGGGRRKPAFYALRQAHAPRLLTIQPGLEAVLVNETGEVWAGQLEVSWRGYDGKAAGAKMFEVSCPAWGIARVPLPADGGGEVVIASLPGTRAWWFSAEDRDSALAPPDFQASVVPVDGGVEVSVTAGNLLRDLALLADKVDPEAVVDGMLHNLLPGESVTWRVKTTAPADPELWLSPSVLRSANQLVVLG